MRWTIWVDGDDIYMKPLPGWTKVEVIPASFTDEDVEDAARAMATYDGDVCFQDDTGHRDAGRKHYRDYARAALSAYLEGKT